MEDFAGKSIESRGLPEELQLPISSSMDTPQQYPKRGRPRLHGIGRQQNQSLRTSITYAHKLSVINFYDAHQHDINATVRMFYSHLNPSALASRKRQIYKWIKERSTIENMCFKQSTATQSRRRDKGTATILTKEAEQEIVEWIMQVRSDGKKEISNQAIKQQAKEVADKYGIPSGRFQATWSWQQGFFKRHNLSINTTNS